MPAVRRARFVPTAIFLLLAALAFRDAPTPLLALERLPLLPRLPKKGFPHRLLIPKSMPS